MIDRGETSVCVVLPLFGNQESVRPLVVQLKANLGHYDLRIVGVDDESPDGAAEVLKATARQLQLPYQLIKNPKNRGQHESIVLGIEQASADILVVMDADGQDPPTIAAELVDRLHGDERISLAIACRRDDASPRFKSITSLAFKFCLFWAVGSKVPLGIGAFYAMRSSAKDLVLSPGLDPSLLPLFLVNRMPTVFHDYDREARVHGKSGYSFRSRLRYAWRVLKHSNTLRAKPPEQAD
ncbi:MAG: glycosyltransferase involved in cell wall biosynthesis [Rhodothermales bacterium]|jgi:glycosyltransferase involved in cell wall biosynthesis